MLLWLLIWLHLRTAAIQIWEYGRANDSLGDFALPAGVCPRIIAKGSETDIVGSHEGREGPTPDRSTLCSEACSDSPVWILQATNPERPCEPPVAVGLCTHVCRSAVKFLMLGRSSRELVNTRSLAFAVAWASTAVSEEAWPPTRIE